MAATKKVVKQVLVGGKKTSSGALNAPGKSHSKPGSKLKRARKSPFLVPGKVPVPPRWIRLLEPREIESVTTRFTGEGFPGTLVIDFDDAMVLDGDAQINFHRFPEMWAAVKKTFGPKAEDVLEEFMQDVFKFGAFQAYNWLCHDPLFIRSLKTMARQFAKQAKSERPNGAPRWVSKKG
jgi:hypothetical protein